MHIGAGVPSLSRKYFTRRKLLASCFVEFVRLPSGADHPILRSAALPICAKEALACQIRLLHEGEHGWRGIQARENTSHLPGHTEQRAAQRLLCPKYRRDLVGKETKVAFWSKPTLGMVFLHGVEYTLPAGRYLVLVLWSF